MKFSVVFIILPVAAALAQHAVEGFQGGHAGGAQIGVRAGNGGHRPSGQPPYTGRPVYPFGWPLWLGDYDYGNSLYSPAPNLLVMQQPPAYVMLRQPSVEPSKPEIYEYKNLPPGPISPPEGEPQTFALVLKDGTVDSAIGVAVQNDMLHLVEPDGRHRSIPLASIDREATRRINHERKLDLQIPPTMH
jgi:hypothetical protein